MGEGLGSSHTCVDSRDSMKNCAWMEGLIPMGNGYLILGGKGRVRIICTISVNYTTPIPKIDIEKKEILAPG